jgi:hypothetical protein
VLAEGFRDRARFRTCPHHWRKVPKRVQARVWATYRRGQEVDKRPSLAYLTAQQMAVAMVALDEGHQQEAARATEAAVRFAWKADGDQHGRLVEWVRRLVNASLPGEVADG